MRVATRRIDYHFVRKIFFGEQPAHDVFCHRRAASISRTDKNNSVCRFGLSFVIALKKFSADNIEARKRPVLFGVRVEHYDISVRNFQRLELRLLREQARQLLKNFFRTLVPDNDNRLARIISVKIFELRMIEQKFFRLPFKRNIDFYAGVAEEKFFSSNLKRVTQRKIFQEVKNFFGEVRLLDGGRFYVAGNPAVELPKKISLLVEEGMQISFVDVAAQKDDVFLLPMFNQPMQRLDIFFALAHAVKIIAEKNHEVFFRHVEFLPKRLQLVICRVHVADCQYPFIRRIVDGRNNRFKILIVLHAGLSPLISYLLFQFVDFIVQIFYQAVNRSQVIHFGWCALRLRL